MDLGNLFATAWDSGLKTNPDGSDVRQSNTLDVIDVVEFYLKQVKRTDGEQEDVLVKVLVVDSGEYRGGMLRSPYSFSMYMVVNEYGDSGH